MTYQELLNRKICPVCKQSANINCDETWDIKIECPKCGKYKTTRELIEDDFVYSQGEYNLEKLSSYLYYHKSDKLIAFLGTSIETPGCSCVSSQTVENWYPKTFAQKIDLILLKLKEDSKYDGEPISIKDEILFLKKDNESMIDSQRQYIHNFLLRNGYIEKTYAFTYMLTPRALERVYELQKNQVHNKKVFVAMKFGDKTKELREKIKEGLIGYDIRIMDEIEHNHQIVPEMLKEIKDSRFVVAELSHHNNGAYYEAGYALGLGKEVIHICAKSELKSGLHFDVAQVNTLVYDSIDDIPRLLKRRIEATIL